MPTYVLPQVLVFQDFSTTASVVANPLRAHISGGHAYLCRYAEADERSFGFLGYYDNAIDTNYLWPHRPAGGVVDGSYVKLWIKDALLQYLEDTASGAGTVTKLAGYNNRVASASVNFAANGAYLRDADLLDRDVQLGDTVKLRVFPVDEDPITIWTYVKDVIGVDVPAVPVPIAPDSNNADNDTVDAEPTLISLNDENCVVATADGSGYDGLAAGHVAETYFIRVTEGSVNGDLTTATLRVTSASGTDDAATVTPSASGVPTLIGGRGLAVTFTVGSDAGLSQSAENEGISADDLVAGQEWEVIVSQTYTAPTPAVTGTSACRQDTTYIVEVVKGGTWADEPQIRVTTTNGVDMSGPDTVTGSGAITYLGTYGLFISFTGTGLCLGDRWYYEISGVSAGPMRILELGHNIPATVDAGSAVDLTLFIRKPLLQIPQNREDAAPEVNWETSETEFITTSGITAYDESWTDSGVPQPLDVSAEEDKGYGAMYVEYRAWLPTLASEVGTISDVADLDNVISGALSPDNPLKWGVYKALSNSNGTEVKFTAVANPDDLESWVGVLELLLGRDDVYGLVPLTRDQDVLDLYAAHVDSMAAPEQGLWRVLWLNLAGIPQIPVVSNGSAVAGHTAATTVDGGLCLCTFSDDPDISSDQYTIMICPAGNSAFHANDVRPGDIVRALYVGDGFGNYTWSEFVIDEVQSEDQLRLMTGPRASQETPAKIEIWRNLTATEESAAIAAAAGAWNSRRIRAVWPDSISSGGTSQEGYFLCAALAGLASGVLPHQSLTNVAVAGFDDVGRTTSKFNRPQLDVMAVSGVWIVTQNLLDGDVYTRHAATTGNYADINQREEMLTRNVDSISYRFKDEFAPYIGVTNVTPSLVSKLEREVNLLISTLQTERYTEDLGGQLISAEIARLSQHLTLMDRIVLVLNVTVPYALNNFEIHLVI